MIVHPTITRVKEVKAGKAVTETATATLHDSEGNQYGGGPAHTAVTDPESLWTRKERSQWRNFLYYYRMYEDRRGVEKELINEEMLHRFGTTSPVEYQAILNLMMTADPRLTVKTRRGEVRTTVEGQAIFAHKARLEDSTE